MPKYKNPATGEEVEQAGDGQTEFYLSRGWVLVSNAPTETVTYAIGFDTGPEVVEFDEAVKTSKKGKGL